MTIQLDRDYLGKLAAQVTEGVILEIGSKKGLSAYAMASVAKVPVYCIDMWDLTFLGDKRPGIHLLTDEEFREKTKGLNVIPIKGLSAEIAKVWNLPIGLLFIDGNHSYKGCMNDYKGFAPYIIPGGYLVFHDYEERFKDKVVKAVDEIKKLDLWTDWELAGFSTISARRR